MRTFGEHLDTYIAALGLENDNQLANKLGVSRQYVWKLRHQGKASDELCLRIAQTIKAQGAEVLIARNAMRESGEVGEAWRAFTAKVGGFFLIVLAGLLYIHAPESLLPEIITMALWHFLSHLKYLRYTLNSRVIPAFFLRHCPMNPNKKEHS